MSFSGVGDIAESLTQGRTFRGAGEESPASPAQAQAGFAGGSGHSVRSPIQKRWPPSRDDDDGETAALIALLLGDD